MTLTLNLINEIIYFFFLQIHQIPAFGVNLPNIKCRSYRTVHPPHQSPCWTCQSIETHHRMIYRSSNCTVNATINPRRWRSKDCCLHSCKSQDPMRPDFYIHNWFLSLKNLNHSKKNVNIKFWDLWESKAKLRGKPWPIIQERP